MRLDPAELTLTTALRHLRAEHGVRSLLCEGGPTLMGALLHERLVDELFLTLAPQLAGGGTGPTMSSGPALAGTGRAGARVGARARRVAVPALRRPHGDGRGRSPGM